MRVSLATNTYIEVEPAITSTGTGSTNLVVTDKQHIAIPMYIYPTWWVGSDWDRLSNPAVNFVIMNPSSGPGTSSNSDYVQQVTWIKNGTGPQGGASLGIRIVGYVDTNYTARTLADVELDIDRYYSWYGVDGIFFDRVSTSPSDIAYYQTLYAYVKAKPNTGFVILNPGTQTDESYMSASDVVVNFEGSYATYSGAYPANPGWVTNYSSDRFWHIVYDTPNYASMVDTLDLAYSRNCFYHFITDRTLASNPFGALPGTTYWDNFQLREEGIVPVTESGTATESINLQIPVPDPATGGAESISLAQVNLSVAESGTSHEALTGATTLALSTSGTSATTEGVVSNAPRMAIPMYIYPTWYLPGGSDWDRLVDPPIAFVVMNPASGPGGSFNSDYGHQIPITQALGIKVFGYVDTSYGSILTATVESQVDDYYTWYGVDGIFFDQVSNSPADISYYTTIYNYVHTKAATPIVVINPGTQTDEGYMAASDVVVNFEGSYTTYTTGFAPNPAWVSNYAAARFWHIIYDVPAISNMVIVDQLARTRNAGYEYITDRTLASNPFGALPGEPYFTTTLDRLQNIIDAPDTASGSETASLFVSPAQTDTASGSETETFATITPSVTETRVGSEALNIAATLSTSDSATAATSASIQVEAPITDSGSLTDVPTLGTITPAVTDGLTTGAEQVALGTITPAVPDATTTLDHADVGFIGVTPVDSASASETATIGSVSSTVDDTSIGIDEPTLGTITLSQTDSSLAQEGVSIIAGAPNVLDGGVGSDSTTLSTVAPLTVDGGVGQTSTSLGTVAVPVSDAGSGIDEASVNTGTYQVPVADTGSGATAVASGFAGPDVPEVGLGQEGITFGTIAISESDSSAALDNVSLAGVTPTVSDVAGTTEVPFIAIQTVQVDDQFATGGESLSIQAQAAVTDSALTGEFLSATAAVPVVDTALGTDSALPSATMVVSDTASPLDSISIPTVSSTIADSAVGVDSPAIGILISDLAVGYEQVAGVSIDVVDSATAVDSVGVYHLSLASELYVRGPGRLVVLVGD
jgi:hypothetical protein